MIATFFLKRVVGQKEAVRTLEKGGKLVNVGSNEIVQFSASPNRANKSANKHGDATTYDDSGQSLLRYLYHLIIPVARYRHQREG